MTHTIEALIVVGPSLVVVGVLVLAFAANNYISKQARKGVTQPSMATRKDYETVAVAMRTARPDPTRDDLYCIVARNAQWRADIERMSTAFLDDNPRFDTAKFKQACGWEDE